MSPKSVKRDGTPKKRWTSAERANRGHKARRSGGVSRSTRNEEFPGRERRTDSTSSQGASTGVSRESRPVSRESRPVNKARTRPDRAEWPSRSARDNSKRSFSRNAPEGRDSRGSSSSRFERPERNDRFQRDDRPQRSEGFRRDDRPQRSDRREGFHRDDRPQRSDRSDRFQRDDRPQRNDGFGRSDRGDRPQRNDRFQRDDRPQRSDRSEGFRRNDRDDRPQRSDRSNSDRNGGFRRNDRPQRSELNQSQQCEPSELSNDVIETPAAVASFTELGVPAPLVSALRSEGIVAPFPIQAAAIPDALAGKDVLGRGQTGSGKTLAFGLPMIATLAGAASSLPRAIVMVPTRELAMQVHDVLNPLAKTADLSVTLVAGGMSYTPQLKAFQRGVDIVVATPGRLIDLMDQGAVDLSRIEIVVLDEADHMADLGFLPDMTTILDTVPTGGQRLLFSATLDGAVNRLVRTYLKDPVTHQVDSGRASVTTMAHHLVPVAPKDKAQVAAEIAARNGRTLVFVRTQLGADRVAEQLRAAGVLAGSLHGGLPQGARTRILAVFKDGSLPVLVATDVAARGIHVDEVGLVLQVDPPGGPKEYLHRAGRTARAGGTGTVVTLVLPHQRRELSRLTGQAGVKASELSGQPGDAKLSEATGARVLESGPVADAEYQRLIAPPKGRRHHAGDRSYGKRSGGGRGQGRGRHDAQSGSRRPRRDA